MSKETTIDVHRLRKVAKKSKLFFPAVNVNDYVTTLKFDNV